MEDKSKIKAPFNMALNTLERLGDILTQIRRIGADPMLPPEIKQSMKVSLVKQFFIQASPLIPNYPEDDRKKIINLKPNQQPIKKLTPSGEHKSTQMVKTIYDAGLEIEMDTMLLNVQRKLQDEGYFMPPKHDPSAAVGEF